LRYMKRVVSAVFGASLFVMLAVFSSFASAGPAMDEVEKWGSAPGVDSAVDADSDATAAAKVPNPSLKICAVTFKGVDPKPIEKMLPRLSELLFGVSVALVKTDMEIPAKAFVDVRNKYYAGRILDDLEAMKTDDCIAIIGYVNEPIFVGRYPRINGVGNPKQNAALVSFFMLGEGDDDLHRHRALSESMHELGHVFGFEHCPFSFCAMMEASDVSTLDSRSESFCRFHIEQAYIYLKGKGAQLKPFVIEKTDMSKVISNAPNPPLAAQSQDTDRLPPEVTSITPGDGAVTGRNVGTVSAKIYDPGGTGVDPASVKVMLDGMQLNVQFHESRSEFEAWAGELEPGTHSIFISASDAAGNVMSPYKITFTAQ
jgi:archaemetzincin